MKINKWIIFGSLILSLFLAFFMINGDSKEVCIDNNCFSVEVVDTPESRQNGLMHREELKKNRGMLFVFEEEGNYPFWMKNTLIPLDMIWIDSEGKIVDIKEADPCVADPCQIIYHTGIAKYVLEINKGLSLENSISIGDLVESDIFRDYE